MILQTLGPGLIMPLFFAFNTALQQRENYVGLETVAVTELSLSLTIAYVVPVFVMSLPAPTLISYDLKQQVIALWQAWPLLVSASMCLLCLAKYKRRRGRAKTGPTEEAMLRHVYGFAFSYAGFCHILSLAVSIFASIYPSSHELLAAQDLSLKKVFLPDIPPPRTAPVSVEEGILRFLHWDYGLAALATLVWGVSLYVQGLKEEDNKIDYVRLLWRVLIMTVLLGPCAVAIDLVREQELRQLSKKQTVLKPKTF